MEIDRKLPITLLLAPTTRAACMGYWTMRLYTAYVYLTLLAAKVKVVFDDYLKKGAEFERCLPGRSNSFRGARIYGVAMFLGNKTNALRFMRTIREKNPSGFVVAFGPFASVYYRQLLERGLADIVIISDAEFVFPQLLNSDNFVNVANLAYLKQGKVVFSPRRKFNDLDSLPFAGQYFCDKGLSPIPVVTARGCSFKCPFCDRTVLWGKGFKMRSVDNVVAEIDFLVRRYGAEKFVFEDANFTVNKRRAKQLCCQLMKLPKRIYWDCSTRVDCADPQVFRFMKSAGCGRVYFGVESADEKILKRLGKPYRRKEIIRAVQWARDVGLKVSIFLVVGSPGENSRSIRKTKRLLLDTYPFSELTVNPLVVLPGTSMYVNMVKAGAVSEEDYFEKDALAFSDQAALAYMNEFDALKKFLES